MSPKLTEYNPTIKTGFKKLGDELNSRDDLPFIIAEIIRREGTNS